MPFDIYWGPCTLVGFYMVGKHYFLSVDVLGQTAMMLGSDLKLTRPQRPKAYNSSLLLAFSPLV